jgi:hypothetical protein
VVVKENIYNMYTLGIVSVLKSGLYYVTTYMGLMV